MYQLQSPPAYHSLLKGARGTAQKGIYLKSLSEVSFALPPLAEQRRIVAKIEELFSELDKGIENLKLAQAQLTGSAARTNANHVIILLTDGIPTTGNTNIAALTQGYCQSNNIITDVITFSLEASTGAYQSAMQLAATNGNGLYFNAPTSSQLQTAFQTIADSLPAVYIK